MKQYIFPLLLIFALTPTLSFADSDGHALQKELEGKELWENFQNDQVACQDLSEDDFWAIGEFSMGLMLGESHEAMNEMMEQRMGEENERLMHVVMGKRLTACDTSAQFPFSGVGMMPMMGIWGLGIERGGDGFMMNFGMNTLSGFGGVLGLIFIVIFWTLVILAIIALIKWLSGQFNASGDSSALDILKKRYAKGEINKKEFEEKRKDIRF